MLGLHTEEGDGISPDEPAKRSLNQAFFKKLYVLPEWDESKTRPSCGSAAPKPTEPYALLLADDLTEGVPAETEALKAQAAQEERAQKADPALRSPSLLLGVHTSSTTASRDEDRTQTLYLEAHKRAACLAFRHSVAARWL